jgi:hypothetical protein
MNRRKASRYGIAAGLLLALLLLLKSKDLIGGLDSGNPVGRKLSSLFAGPGSEGHQLGKPTKTGRLRESRKPASEEAQKKFKRFFLPPLKLENASLAQAMDRIIQEYRNTAVVTREVALDLRVDTSGARADATLNCTTPRAPADAVIRYVAALSGYRVKGSLPDFRLVALEQTPDRKGSVEGLLEADVLAEFFERQKKPAEAKLTEDPFGDNGHGSLEPPSLAEMADSALRDLLRANGFNKDAEFSLTPDGRLHYEHLSEAEIELLGTLVRFSSTGESGPIQMQARTTIVQITDSAAQTLSNGMVLSGEQSQLALREFASTQGAEVMSMALLSTREGQTGTIVVTGNNPEPAGPDDTWIGVRMASASVPLGLGSEVEYAFEVRETGGTRTKGTGASTLPAGGNGVIVAPREDGKKLIFMHTTTPVDATGRILAEAP